jgi:hypothetical protein
MHPLSARYKFAPAVAGFALWAAATAAPFTIANVVDAPSPSARNDYNRVASALTMITTLLGAMGGMAASNAFYRRLERIGNPSSEAEVIEDYLQDKIFGGQPLFNTRLHVEEIKGGYQLRVRFGTAAQNAPDASGVYAAHTLPAKLSNLGFDLSGVTFKGGGQATQIRSQVVITPLEYDIKANSLPNNLWGRIGDFQVMKPRSTTPKMA